MSRTEKNNKIINQENNNLDAESLLKEKEELELLKQEILKEKEELALEKEAFRIEKINVEQELQSQKNTIKLTKEIEKKDFAEARRTAEILKQDIVKIKVPVDKNNRDDLLVPVTINGYTWTIKRGETVEVPAAVADLLEQADYL